jgi:hypothetical protein
MSAPALSISPGFARLRFVFQQRRRFTAGFRRFVLGWVFVAAFIAFERTHSVLVRVSVVGDIKGAQPIRLAARNSASVQKYRSTALSSAPKLPHRHLPLRAWVFSGRLSELHTRFIPGSLFCLVVEALIRCGCLRTHMIPGSLGPLNSSAGGIQHFLEH